MSEGTRKRVFWWMVVGIFLLIGGEVMGRQIAPNGELTGIGPVLVTIEVMVIIWPWVKSRPWLRIIIGVLIFCGYWAFTVWVKAVYGQTWATIAWAILIIAAFLYVGRQILVWAINLPNRRREHRSHDE